jgi:YihY family inner membrane protein
VNLAERTVRAVDGQQQRHAWIAFIFAIVKKYGDDRGPQLSALLTYYGFMSLFPLLLIFTTILGFIGNDHIEHSVVGTTLAQFPVFGEQIGKDAAHPLTGSGVGLAIGLVLLLYGTLGLAQAAQHVMAQLWNVPGVVRPGFFPRLYRSLMFFSLLAAGMVASTAVNAVVTGHGHNVAVRVIALVVTAVINVGMYVAAFRVLTPKSIATRDLWPGAMFAGIVYTILLTVGTALVQHQLRHAQALYGQFAFVLGLMAWLFLVAQLTVYAAEFNVVRTRRLWPRSIVQPPLTDADQRVLGAIARQEERRPEQTVDVAFESSDRHAAGDPA